MISARRPPMRVVKPPAQPLFKPLPPAARIAAQSAAAFAAVVALAAYATFAVNRMLGRRRQRVAANRRFKLSAFDEALVAFESFSSLNM
ncbi:hypothetical protein FGB62_4g327 [Gracilaria domingensis]|nr:hypothetical protein FGB62_4g327 [Gracilaria domingensis]